MSAFAVPLSLGLTDTGENPGNARGLFDKKNSSTDIITSGGHVASQFKHELIVHPHENENHYCHGSNADEPQKNNHHFHSLLFFAIGFDLLIFKLLQNYLRVFRICVIRFDVFRI